MCGTFGDMATRAQEIRLQKLTSKTAARALPLLEAQYREHEIEMGGARLSRALRELVRGQGLIILAEEPASPATGGARQRGALEKGTVGVAVVSWMYSPEKAGRIAWLEELYVAPGQRGRGLGALLIERAAREARRAGCVSMELEVLRGHERAARLYLREGFVELPRRRYSRRLV
jgi:GNAT superfamily N-acetyltransferase